MYFEKCIEKLYPKVNAKEYFLHDGNGKSDYAFNQVKALAKVLNRPAEDLVQEIMNELKNVSFIEVEAKHTTILINMKDEYLSREINVLFFEVLKNKCLPTSKKIPVTCLVDYSSPNIAKQMHVGHLRSTIIGESLCRLYEYMGDKVLRRNHIGDWGTQFGMLITYVKKNDVKEYDITELTNMYKEAKKMFDSSEEFKSEARHETYKLQQGDAENKELWRKIVDISLKEFDKIYQILDTHADIKGESFYQEYMEKLVREIPLTDHEGMKVFFTSSGAHLILVKGEEGGRGFTYDTSDLAALKYRLDVEKADKIVYVVDLGQQLHFETLFQAAKELKFVDNQKLEYVGFGVVLSVEGKKLKTRSGETIKLSSLLDEAYESALAVNENPELARKISLNCVKYADLTNPRISNYKYDVKKMLNTKGNTAVYLMYAMARCKSILRKVDFSSLAKYEIILDTKQSRDLIFLILKYPELLMKAYETSSPHILCNYLYSIVTTLSKFYETNRCIEFKEGTISSIHSHRICLIYLSSVLIDKLFYLIGLEDIEQI